MHRKKISNASILEFLYCETLCEVSAHAPCPLQLGLHNAYNVKVQALYVNRLCYLVGHSTYSTGFKYYAAESTSI